MNHNNGCSHQNGTLMGSPNSSWFTQLKAIVVICKSCFLKNPDSSQTFTLSGHQKVSTEKENLKFKNLRPTRILLMN